MKNLLSLPLFLILCASSCEKLPFGEYFYEILLVNKSNCDLYVYPAYRESENVYPDTLLPISYKFFNKVSSNSDFTWSSQIQWKEIIQKLPADTLSVFFIDATIFENVAWDTIRKNYLILKRYDLSIEDLEKTDYTITYP